LLPEFLSRVHEGSRTEKKPFQIRLKREVEQLKSKNMGVYLREKQLKGGKISYYLDIYHNQVRWPEFLGIHINKKRPTPEDKEKRELANEIRCKRENELIVQDNGLIDKNRKKANYVVWFENYLKETGRNNSQNWCALAMLKKYVDKRPLPFSAITPVWIKGFTDFMLARVSNNTTRNYLMNMFTSLEDAVRQEIIPTNPFRKIERRERIRRQDVFRKAYTFEELQLLANTPCEINKQYKQAYFFSCSTGLRWSDVNPLKWTEVITKRIEGEERCFIYFEQEKTEGIEYFPLSDQAVEIIKERAKDTKENKEISPYVFPDVKEYNAKYNLQYRKVSRGLKKWAKMAGLDPKQLTFHTSRHTFATNILENSPDADLWTVSKLLGHKSIQATQIYAHVRDSKKLAAVKALPKINMAVVHTKVA
jgi:integrase